jgi:hypothetical protein
MSASASANPAATPLSQLPQWAIDLIALYESNTSNQFILYGNVADRMVLPGPGETAQLGSVYDFLLHGLLPRFDVVLSYDLGNGIRVEKGNDIFSQWPALKEMPQLPRAPRQAIEALTIFFRYAANLARLKRGHFQVACIIRGASLAAPALQGALNYDLNALAMLIRDWSTDSLLLEHSLATFLVTENLNDLHPLLATNPRAAQVKIPLPAPREIEKALAVLWPEFPLAVKNFDTRKNELAAQLAGSGTAAIESLLKMREYTRESITDADIAKLKKQLIEQDCNGLIEFAESQRTFDDLQGQEKIKAWLRQDFDLWRRGDLQALPMGYLLCGPVGTGKTFTAECLAGEAGVPVVKIKNFRDKWIGSTEGNLEKIFRLLHALGRCFVFIDEADQSLGKRDSQSSDGGVSGRVYSMMAAEMGDTRNRGKIIWILASSRPDLIEVDLKRPGRIDVKIPLFPTSTPAEGMQLIAALCKRKGIEIPAADIAEIEASIPILMTPGAAETLATKVYRVSRTQSLSPAEALRACIAQYRNPIDKDVMEFQIGLAVREATDAEFIPPAFQQRPPATVPAPR